jgi:hypothetical protein
MLLASFNRPAIVGNMIAIAALKLSLAMIVTPCIADDTRLLPPASRAKTEQSYDKDLSICGIRFLVQHWRA